MCWTSRSSCRTRRSPRRADARKDANFDFGCARRATHLAGVDHLAQLLETSTWERPQPWMALAKSGQRGHADARRQPAGPTGFAVMLPEMLDRGRLVRRRCPSTRPSRGDRGRNGGSPGRRRYSRRRRRRSESSPLIDLAAQMADRRHAPAPPGAVPTSCTSIMRCAASLDTNYVDAVARQHDVDEGVRVAFLELLDFRLASPALGACCTSGRGREHRRLKVSVLATMVLITYVCPVSLQRTVHDCRYAHVARISPRVGQPEAGAGCREDRIGGDRTVVGPWVRESPVGSAMIMALSVREVTTPEDNRPIGGDSTPFILARDIREGDAREIVDHRSGRDEQLAASAFGLHRADLDRYGW